MLYEKFEVIEDFRFGAFVLHPLLVLSGPDWFRYRVARGLVQFDRWLCKTGVCKGTYRIMIARKPHGPDKSG